MYRPDITAPVDCAHYTNLVTYILLVCPNGNYASLQGRLLQITTPERPLTCVLYIPLEVLYASEDTKETKTKSHFPCLIRIFFLVVALRIKRESKR